MDPRVDLRAKIHADPSLTRRSKARTVSLARRALLRGSSRKASRGAQRISIFIAALGILVAALAAPAVAMELTPLPPGTDISPGATPQDLQIYDRNGTLLADISNQGNHRIVVPLSAISKPMVNATIAIEDRTFYSNVGVDPIGIGRAAFDDITHGRLVQGGSTITQQLVKRLFFGPTPPATLQRKVKEAILAMKLSQLYSKNQILEAYLNTIYYSNQAYGIEAAARTYFHVGAAQLNLAQASLLAGIPRAPTLYNPVLNPRSAHARQLDVLAAMVKQGNITKVQAARAAATPLQVFQPSNTVLAPSFVSYVLNILDRQFHITPFTTRAVKVVTSLDLNLQQEAEHAIQVQVSGPGRYYNFHDGALVSLDPQTGEILAMVGRGPGNQAYGDIDMATSPTRQVGSAFKIFTYTAAIESRKLNMNSPILDAPLNFPIGGPNNGPYAPMNYDLKWHGVLPLKTALGNSLNIPGIKAELYTGIPSVLDVARRMGVTTLTQADSSYGPSLTLGSYPVPVIDMAVGAATLADMGIRHEPSAILTITDAFGQTAYNYDPSANASAAVSPQVAYIMGAILSDDRNRCMEFGCGGDLTLPGRQVAAKTGTSQGFRDNWTLGYTPTLATAVWVGNPDDSPLARGSTGIVGAAPIWHQFMRRALQGVPNQWYPMPPGVDAVGGNYFLPGTENLPPALAGQWPVCPFYQYDPNQLTWSAIQVNGVPCTLGSPTFDWNAPWNNQNNQNEND